MITGRLKTMSELRGTLGGWVIHHDQKLTGVSSPDFEAIGTAGRAATLLSLISRESETTISDERVKILAQGAKIRAYHLPGLLAQLETAGLIDRSESGVAVLGVTQARLLEYAANLFDQQSPQAMDRAAIELAERASSAPIKREDCAEEISDNYQLGRAEMDDLFRLSEEIGFVDVERERNDVLYFNGSLFRREDAPKVRAVLDHLVPEEQRRLSEGIANLDQKGCLPVEEMKRLLGEPLWRKLHRIAFFDVSIMVNEKGSNQFVMRPSALTKFVPGGLADQLHDAKALTASLTYGIIKSSKMRGNIRDPEALLNALINRGYVEGWASALKEDYKLLERRNVVTLSTSQHGHKLTLNKPEIGMMAKELILKGDASHMAAGLMIGTQAAGFVDPDTARKTERLKDIPEAQTGAARALLNLRRVR